MEEMSNDILQQEVKQKIISSLKKWSGRKEKITILGHDNIDVDATISGILLSHLFDFLEIPNEFCVLEPVRQNETDQILKELTGINLKDWEKEGEDEKRSLFLVDHYETIHAGKVIGCIDHHPTIQQMHCPLHYVENSCATAYLIYELMKEIGYRMKKEEINQIIVAMMVDTTSFRSSKTIQKEVEVAKQLAATYQLDYKYLERYCLCLTPINKLTIKEIISNGQKWYQYNGNKVGSSYLQLYGIPDNKVVYSWLKALKAKRQETKSDMLVFIIFETQNNITYEYRVTQNDAWQRFVHHGILSRGKDIMPIIEAMYH